MMRRTHAAAGLMIGFGLAASQSTSLLDGILIALVSETAALIPDLDLKLKIKHRGLTHSLLALAMIAALGLWIDTQSIQKAYSGLIVWALVAGYSSHLVLDLLTVYGIELFYPYHRRIRLLKLRTDSRIDHLIGALMLCGTLYALWLVIPL
jgi:inner membrane protein